jgi:hypothetical protein
MRVSLSPPLFYALRLRDFQLTREAFSGLTSKVELVAENDLLDIISEDQHGNRWSYGDNQIPPSMDDAIRWLWWIELLRVRKLATLPHWMFLRAKNGIYR